MRCNPANRALAGTARCPPTRQWQQAHPEAVYRWETRDGHYRLDVDNEADRQAVEHLTGQSLRWPHDLDL